MGDNQSSRSFEQWASFYTRGNWGPSSGRGCFQGPTGILELRREPCFQFFPSRHMGNSHSYPFQSEVWPMTYFGPYNLSKGKNITIGRAWTARVQFTTLSLLWSNRYSRWGPPGNMGVRGHEAELQPNPDGHKKSEEEYLAFSCPRDPGADCYCGTTEPMLTLSAYAKLCPPPSKARNWAQASHIYVRKFSLVLFLLLGDLHF